MPYIRVGTYSIDHVKKCVMNFYEEILPPSYRFDGYKIKLTSDRYVMFFKKGVVCVSCGLEGSFFALERSVNNRVFKEYKKRDFRDFLRWEKAYQQSLKDKFQQRIDVYHFNLYAINDSGDEVLMTKDHIIPKSKGGKNHLSNYQPMCCYCNCKKDNSLG